MGKEQNKKTTNWFVKAGVRCVILLVAILIINPVLYRYGFSFKVGVNVVSAVTCALLGVPGLALLYGISFLFHTA